WVLKLMAHEHIIKSVRYWLETVVIGLNLCPFAKREWVNKRVRFFVTSAVTEEQLLQDLRAELEYLGNEAAVETTLLIHPDVLQDFHEYNQFLNAADGLLVQMGLGGVYQIASFHPDYQFADSEPDDVENYTNRSPYPILHLIREASLERAIANYPDPDQIPERNMALLRSLGHDRMRALFQGTVVVVADADGNSIGVLD
ncbi:hypothetical protein MNBD_GAMMA13-1679, partial [hydrothermal vent metagenome]